MDQYLKSPYVKVFSIFFIWRIYLFFIAYISPKLIPLFGAKFPYYNERLVSSGLPHFLWSFGNFDGVHYLGIAKNAYSAQFTQAFFPLFPMLIKLVSFVTLGNYVLAGLLVSNITFFVGLLIFYKFITKTFSQNVALWSCLFLLAYPTSYYFGAIYTEGIFFLLVISSFYLFSENKLLLASIIGVFASATRLIGVFLALSLIKGKKIKQLYPLFVIPIGLVLYMAYLYLKFHNAFYFLTAQTVFGQERSTTSIILLPQVFYRYFKILLTTHGAVLTIALFELISTVFAMLVLILATKKMKAEWLIFSWLAILLPTLTGTLTSMPRYVLVAFPIFVYLALIKNVYLKLIILGVSAIILTMATAFFTQGYWVA